MRIGSAKFVGTYIVVAHIIAMNVDDEPGRVQHERRIVAGAVRRLDYDPRSAGLVLRYAHPLHQSVGHVETLAYQLGGKPSIFQIKENAIGLVNTLRLELDILF